MPQTLRTLDRRTNADDVFDYLHEQINLLKLLPGTRISEVEIADRFDVSRQPVREAFIRLSNLGLLLVRPQRATVVPQRYKGKKERSISLDVPIPDEWLPSLPHG